MKTTLLTSENNILQNNVIVQENQLLAALVESSDISIISEDLKGNITFWNKGAENIFGYSAAEVLGRPITFFIPPEHQHEEEVIQQRILAKEQVPHYKTVRVCKDGRYVYVSVTYSPIRDSRGNIVGTSRIGRDITQEHLNNEQMRALAAIVESSDDAIVSEDINGRITSWNHGAEVIYGYSSKEAVGKHVCFFIPHEKQIEEARIEKLILAKQLVSHYETTRICKNGQTVNVRITFSPILNSEGQVVGISRISQDITQERKISEQLQVFSAIIKYSENSIICEDCSGNITFWNKGAEENFGYTAQEAIGQPITFFVPKERWHEEEEILDQIKSGKSIYRHETCRISKNGSRIYGILTVAPIWDAKGNVVGTSRIGVDITQRKQVEEKLRLVVEALNIAANGVVITDQSGKIIWVNTAFEKLTGYTRKEALNQTPRILKSGLHGSSFYSAMWNTISHGEIWQGEVTNKRKDGSLYSEEMTITPLRNESGRITNYIAIKQDISERLKITAERERLLNELQETMAKVKTLTGLLPICASCKRIREDSGYWTQVEVYIQQHSDTQFTHGICPECAKKYLDESNDLNASK